VWISLAPSPTGSVDFEHTFDKWQREVTAVSTAPRTPDAILPPLPAFWSAEPVLPPDPDAGAVQVWPAEPADVGEPGAWADLNEFDLVDPSDRAELDRLTCLDDLDWGRSAGQRRVLDPAAAPDLQAPLDPADPLDLLDLRPDSDPVGVARVLARAADGATLDGEPLGLVAAVGLLTRIDPWTVGGPSRVDLIRGWERVAAMVAGHQQDALAAVAEATTAFGVAGIEARHEVGAALRLAPGTAAERTQIALALTTRLGDTQAALRRGDIAWRQAADLATAVTDLPDPLAAAVQARVLPPMPHRTAAESRRAVQAAIIAADPDGATHRAATAATGRRIERLPQPDSMAAWWMNLPAPAEPAMWAEATRRARATKKALRAAGLPTPSLDALRVDAVVDALLGPGTADHLTPTGDQHHQHEVDADDEDAEDDGMTVLPGADLVDDASLAAAELDLLRAAAGAGSRYLPRCTCGGKQVAAVVVDLPTLLGLAEHPGTIPGYGTIPAPLARAMAADRDWIRWTTDPGTRQVIDRGADTYRPSAKMRAFLAARDRTCGFPGCHRRAQDCDCDHVINHTMPNGQTIAINLGPLCRQHHNAKTHGRWKLSYNPHTGLKTWTSPLGKTYTKGTDPPLS
jgi:hypothetical protein